MSNCRGRPVTVSVTTDQRCMKSKRVHLLKRMWIVDHSQTGGPVLTLQNGAGLRDLAVRMNYCTSGTGHPHFPCQHPSSHGPQGASQVYVNKDSLLREAATSLRSQRSSSLDPGPCHFALQRPPRPLPPALGWPARGQPTPHSLPMFTAAEVAHGLSYFPSANTPQSSGTHTQHRNRRWQMARPLCPAPEIQTCNEESGFQCS